MVHSQGPILRPIKVVGIKLCHNAQRQTARQIPFGFINHFIGLGLGMEQCECTIRKVRQKIDTISFFLPDQAD